MDLALMFALWIGGMIAGALVVLCWVPDTEVQKYCNETEHGVEPL